jgi:hypothetical protein
MHRFAAELRTSTDQNDRSTGRGMGYDPRSGFSPDCHDLARQGSGVGDTGAKVMKTFTAVVAAVTLGLLAAPAAAQMGGKRNRPEEQKAADPNAAKRTAAEERAYKAALERIPDPKEKYDPWGGVVPADSGKKLK